jgi:hypothetical protein
VTLAVRPLTSQTWDALAALFRGGGDPRWCWCQYWRLRSKDFAASKVPELRARLQEQAESDEPPGLVTFDGEQAVGWVGLRVVADRASDPSSAHTRVVVRRELTSR